ncbi:MAG: hypothetical protein HKN73_03910 [Gemmatimonadetes bacterium]|nr:hypothetical protein [Gemmatimonadota bacterium]
MNKKWLYAGVFILSGTVTAFFGDRTDGVAPVGELLEGRDAGVLERRAEAEASFDASQVPRELRDLIPLAIVWGSTDNYSYYASDAEKAELQRRLADRLTAIDRWLATFDMDQPLPLEPSTFFWMRDEYEVADL